MLSAEDSQVLLHVWDAELQDNALYLCALSPHLCPQCAALHKKGRVYPGSDSLPTTACMEL